MTESPPEPPESAAPEHGPVRRYLAEVDVPCPGCRYNLRGSGGTVCPECGLAITLSVGAQRQRWVPPILAFLAFGWVVLAGTFNTARNLHRLYEEAVSLAGGSVAYSFRINSGTGQGTVSGQLAPQFVRLQPTVRTPGLAGLPWTGIPWLDWWPLVWSLILLVGGAAGLICLARHQRRPFSQRGWRFLRWHAVTLFAVYGGYHLFMFVEEVLGW